MSSSLAVACAVLAALAVVVGLHVAVRFLGRARSVTDDAAEPLAPRVGAAAPGSSASRREPLTVRVLPLLVLATVAPVTALLLLWGPALHAPGGHARPFLSGLVALLVLSVGVLHAFRRGEGGR